MINNKHTKLLRRLWPLWIVLIGIAWVMLPYWFFVLRFPLPSDEDMIEQFQEHREEFYELARRYRYFKVGADRLHSRWAEEWVDEEGTGAMLKRTGIERMDESAGGAWLDNPYSIETAKKVVDMIQGGDESRRLVHRYNALIVTPAPRLHYRSRKLGYGDIWKDYYFIPGDPRIEDGKLLWPVNTRGKHMNRARVLDSLDRLPDNWKHYECVYKQLDTHWFISLCNGH